MERIARWVERQDFPETETSILDLGCGNGATLLALVCILYSLIMVFCSEHGILFHIIFIRSGVK